MVNDHNSVITNSAVDQTNDRKPSQSRALIRLNPPPLSRVLTEFSEVSPLLVSPAHESWYSLPPRLFAHSSFGLKPQELRIPTSNALVRSIHTLRTTAFTVDENAELDTAKPVSPPLGSALPLPLPEELFIDNSDASRTTMVTVDDDADFSSQKASSFVYHPPSQLRAEPEDNTTSDSPLASPAAWLLNLSDDNESLVEEEAPYDTQRSVTPSPIDHALLSSQSKFLSFLSEFPPVPGPRTGSAKTHQGFSPITPCDLMRQSLPNLRTHTRSMSPMHGTPSAGSRRPNLLGSISTERLPEAAETTKPPSTLRAAKLATVRSSRVPRPVRGSSQPPSARTPKALMPREIESRARQTRRSGSLGDLCRNVTGFPDPSTPRQPRAMTPSQPLRQRKDTLRQRSLCSPKDAPTLSDPSASTHPTPQSLRQQSMHSISTTQADTEFDPRNSPSEAAFILSAAMEEMNKADIPIPVQSAVCSGVKTAMMDLKVRDTGNASSPASQLSVDRELRLLRAEIQRQSEALHTIIDTVVNPAVVARLLDDVRNHVNASVLSSRQIELSFDEIVGRQNPSRSTRRHRISLIRHELRSRLLDHLPSASTAESHVDDFLEEVLVAPSHMQTSASRAEAVVAAIQASQPQSRRDLLWACFSYLNNRASAA